MLEKRELDHLLVYPDEAEIKDVKSLIYEVTNSRENTLVRGVQLRKLQEEDKINKHWIDGAGAELSRVVKRWSFYVVGSGLAGLLIGGMVTRGIWG